MSDKTKSELYQAVLPILNSGAAELLDLPRMISQFVGLERRTARGGRDSVDHAPGGHDDLANCVAGALTLAYAIGTHQSPLAIGMPMAGASYTNSRHLIGADGWRPNRFSPIENNDESLW
jgi:hypothetical protein